MMGIEYTELIYYSSTWAGSVICSVSSSSCSVSISVAMGRRLLMSLAYTLPTHRILLLSMIWSRPGIPVIP